MHCQQLRRALPQGPLCHAWGAAPQPHRCRLPSQTPSPPLPPPPPAHRRSIPTAQHPPTSRISPLSSLAASASACTFSTAALPWCARCCCVRAAASCASAAPSAPTAACSWPCSDWAAACCARACLVAPESAARASFHPRSAAFLSSARACAHTSVGDAGGRMVPASAAAAAATPGAAAAKVRAASLLFSRHLPARGWEIDKGRGEGIAAQQHAAQAASAGLLPSNAPCAPHCYVAQRTAARACIAFSCFTAPPRCAWAAAAASAARAASPAAFLRSCRATLRGAGAGRQAAGQRRDTDTRRAAPPPRHFLALLAGRGLRDGWAGCAPTEPLEAPPAGTARRRQLHPPSRLSAPTSQHEPIRQRPGRPAPHPHPSVASSCSICRCAAPS